MFVGMIIFFLSLAIMELNGSSFVILIRYTYGNMNQENLHIVLCKCIFILIYACIGYSGFVPQYKTLVNRNKVKLKDFLSGIKNNFLKVIPIILFSYFTISIFVEYINFTIIKTLGYTILPIGYIFGSVLFMYKYVIIILFIMAIIGEGVDLKEKTISVCRFLLSKKSVILLFSLVILGFAVITVISEVVKYLFQIDKNPIQSYLTLVQTYKYRITLTTLCRIYETIVIPFVFIYISIGYEKFGKPSISKVNKWRK